MKKAFKILLPIIIFFVVIPGCAGYAILSLWNSILTAACGFSAISFWQSIGIFLLGQIISGGFVLGCFFLAGCIHHATGHHGKSLGHRWQGMTDEERERFMKRREQFVSWCNDQKAKDVAE